MDLAAGASGFLGERGEAWILYLNGTATMDFETGDDLLTPLANGQDLSSGPEFGRSLALTSSGANRGAAIFDSTPGGPNDPSQDLDLLVGKKNVLILQNSQVPAQSTTGFYDHPNDDPDGGLLRFAFTHPAELLSIDLIDIDPGSSQSARVTLVDAMNRTRIYTVPGGWTEDVFADGPPGWRRLDLTTLAPQPGFQSTATASQSAGFDPSSVSRLEVVLGSSGAVDELRWIPR